MQKGLSKELLAQAPYKEILEKQMMLPNKAYEPIYEGMCIDIGERKLQIITTPGHSPGSICILDINHRYLFSGDSICEAGVLLNLPGAGSVETYLTSMLRLKEYAAAFDVIYAGHQTIPLEPSWIDDYIGCAREILKQPVQPEMIQEKRSDYKRAGIQYIQYHIRENKHPDFTYEYIRKNIIRICDKVQTAMYLIIGEHCACLLDTGTGFGNLAQFVQTLTDKPVFVILTHGHLDHGGGAYLFDDVYIHPADIEVYQEHHCASFRKAMVKAMLGKEIPLPEVVRKQPFYPLEDQQVFDLGGVHIKAIQVPGHTQGMMMILIEEERIMLFGDACGMSVMLHEDWSSEVSLYRQSLLHVKKAYASTYDHVIRNHGTYTSPCFILDEVIHCCDEILLQQDDHIATELFGEEGFYRAQAIDAYGNRLDGKIGNILYRYDKAK